MFPEELERNAGTLEPAEQQKGGFRSSARVPLELPLELPLEPSLERLL
jgi:hypothetical protein